MIFLSLIVKQHTKNICAKNDKLYLIKQKFDVMTTYYKQAELKAAMDQLVEDYMQECKKCDELPEGFVELLKHNFLAKFVCYDSATKTIEIGVEDNSPDALYPRIKVHKYSMEKKNWVKNSFRTERNDLIFYGSLLNRNRPGKDVDVVLI